MKMSLTYAVNDSLTSILPYPSNFPVYEGTISFPYTATDYCMVNDQIKSSSSGTPAYAIYVNGVTVTQGNINGTSSVAHNVFLKPGDVITDTSVTSSNLTNVVRLNRRKPI